MKKTVEEVNRLAGEADQWKNFADFAKYEMAAGGPDPHMKLTAELCKIDGCNWEETAWRGLCYLGVYNVPTAEQIWNVWTFKKALKEGSKLFLPWFTEHWQGITMRRERKSARSPIKMSKYFETAAMWLNNLIAQKKSGNGWIAGNKNISATERYEIAWEDVMSSDSIYSMGRYIGFKYLEYGIQYLGFPIELNDIRAKGGWSPRACLAILWPEQAEVLLGNDSPEEIAIVDEYAKKTKERTLKEYGVNLSYYNLQVLLCDYKQCYVGKRQFPGRSQDSEIMYRKKIEPYWKGKTKIWEGRANIFPPKVLGELNNWWCVREELGKVLYDHGYMWTDLMYDYNLSKHRLSMPVKHGETANKISLKETKFGKFLKNAKNNKAS
jgi:hypothetical protein